MYKKMYKDIKDTKRHSESGFHIASRDIRKDYGQRNQRSFAVARRTFAQANSDERKFAVQINHFLRDVRYRVAKLAAIV